MGRKCNRYMGIVVGFLLVLPAVAATHLDPTFGNGTGLVTAGFDLGGANRDFAGHIVKDTQGRLMLIGEAEIGSDAKCLGLMRFSADGVPDPTFGTNGKTCHTDLLGEADTQLNLDVALQSDGLLLVSGTAFVDDTDPPQPWICRFLENGDEDPNFGAPETPGCRVYSEFDHVATANVSIVLDGPSILLIANPIAMVKPNIPRAYPALMRLSASDGDIEPYGDKPFVALEVADATHDAYTADATLSADGGLILVGAVSSAGGWDSFVLRADQDLGVLDDAFGQEGIVRTSLVQNPSYDEGARLVHAATDGTLLVAGLVQPDDGPPYFGISFLRLDAKTGALDPAFNGGEPKIYSPCAQVGGDCVFYPSSMAVSAKGDIAITGQGGFGNHQDVFVARVRRDGTGDPAFGEDGLVRLDYGSNSFERSDGVLFQDEKIVAGGYVTENANTEFAMFRFLHNGVFHDDFELVP